MTTRRGPRRVIAAALLAAALGALAIAPGLARADGDPASDVLVSSSPLFLSQTGGATFAGKQALMIQLRTAARRGRPLRVAVIATRSDLGSVTALWGHPQAYARFLGRELSLAYHGELLVVMPQGFGVARAGRTVSTSLAGLAPRGRRLVSATGQAITRLTGVATAHAAPLAGAVGPSRVGGSAWWLATGLALAALAAIWSASLRRRPLRRSSAAAHGPRPNP